MDKKENPAVVQSVERTFMIIEELGPDARWDCPWGSEQQGGTA